MLFLKGQSESILLTERLKTGGELHMLTIQSEIPKTERVLHMSHQYEKCKLVVSMRLLGDKTSK